MRQVAGKTIPVVVSLLAVALFIASCGGSDEPTPGDRAKAEPPLYHQAFYDVEQFNGWEQVESDKQLGDVYESAWVDPIGSQTNDIITSTASEDSGSPREEAERSRDMVKRLPSYQPRTFKQVELRKRPATQLTYEIEGIGRVEYYFEACGIHYAFVATTAASSFELPMELRYRRMAKLIKPICP